MARILITISFLLGCMTLAASAQQATAPTAQPGASSNTQPDQKALDFVEIKKFMQARAERIKDLEKKIEEGIKNAKEAEQRADEAIAEYQAIVDALGSKSKKSAQIDEFITLYERFAAEAAADPNPNIRAHANDLLSIARTAREIKQGFIDESDRAYRNIERMKQLKGEAVTLFRIQQGQQVNAAFREQLVVLREANERVELTINQAEKKLPPAGPRVQ